MRLREMRAREAEIKAQCDGDWKQSGLFDSKLNRSPPHLFCHFQVKLRKSVDDKVPPPPGKIELQEAVRRQGNIETDIIEVV